ncbi:MAG: hypothetical protein NTW29_06280 [Bacteroidetes bacterium]|nr:hypothetical protein [Bacteroidota bacterium]
MRRFKKVTTVTPKRNWEFYFGIIGITIGLVGLVVSYKSCTSARDIAADSGSFDRPNLVLGIANYILPNNNSQDTTALIFCRTNNDSSVNICNLPFQISNFGKKTAQDIKALIEFPKITSLAVMDTSALVYSAPKVTSFIRSINENKESNFITYSIGEINPGLMVEFNEPFNFHKTEVKTSVPINDTFSFNVNVSYSLPFNISLTAKDIPSQRQHFSITTVLDTSVKSVVNLFVKNTPRIKNGSKSFLVFTPQKEIESRYDSLKLVQYNICKACYFLVGIKDTSPNQDMIVVFYDHENKLSKIYVYDENSIFKQELVIDK